MISDADQILEHYGVRGMKWGKRKSSSGTSTAKPTRKQKKEAKRAQVQAKVDRLITEALKGDKTLVQLNGRTVITGDQFIQHLSRGGLMDIKRTEIWATRTGDGEFTPFKPPEN